MVPSGTGHGVATTAASAPATPRASIFVCARRTASAVRQGKGATEAAAARGTVSRGKKKAAAAARRGKGRSRIGRLIYWGAVLALMGGHLCHRHSGLDRHPSSADPIARNPQAPAFGSDRRLKWRDARHPRRHGRRRGAAARNAGLCAQGIHRHRGPPLLFPPRRRSVGNHARARSPTCCAAAPRKAVRPSPNSSPRIFFLPRSARSRASRRKWCWRSGSNTNSARRRFSSSISTASISAAGAYGVEAAAQRYFGKSARHLTLAEAAMLAGLVQSPSRLAPSHNPDGAERRARARARPTWRNKKSTGEDAVQARAVSSRACGEDGHGRLGQLCRRLGHGRGRRPHRPLRRGYRGRDHDRSGAARRGRARARRNAGAEGREVRRRRRRAGRHDAGRRGACAGRRTQLRRKPVQPRHRRQAAARFRVQAVRLSHRARARAHARHGQGRRADRRARAGSRKTTSTNIWVR